MKPGKHSKKKWFIGEDGLHPVKSNVDRCSLLLRILKVYRTGIHSGYIQYTYRGFHIPHLESAPHDETAMKIHRWKSRGSSDTVCSSPVFKTRNCYHRAADDLDIGKMINVVQSDKSKEFQFLLNVSCWILFCFCW